MSSITITKTFAENVYQTVEVRERHPQKSASQFPPASVNQILILHIRRIYRDILGYTRIFWCVGFGCPRNQGSLLLE